MPRMCTLAAFLLVLLAGLGSTPPLFAQENNLRVTRSRIRFHGREALGSRGSILLVARFPHLEVFDPTRDEVSVAIGPDLSISYATLSLDAAHGVRRSCQRLYRSKGKETARSRLRLDLVRRRVVLRVIRSDLTSLLESGQLGVHVRLRIGEKVYDTQVDHGASANGKTWRYAAERAKRVSSPKPSDGEIPFRILERGMGSRIEVPKTRVIRSRGAFADLWCRNHDSWWIPVFLPGDVDFNEEMVVVVYQGLKTSTDSYGITVLKVTALRGAIRVHYEELPPFCSTGLAFSSPYVFAVLPRMKAPVSFHRVVADSCR